MLFWNKLKKVLIIDDDRTLLRRVSINLKKYKDLDITIHDNAIEGLLTAKKIHPNLIILDWTLPDIQGIDLLKILKNTAATKDIPILMLTGHNKLGNIEDAFAIGADAYITKPFSLKKLAKTSFNLMK